MKTTLNTPNKAVKVATTKKPVEKRIIEAVTTKPEKVKVEKKVSFKEQIEGNKLFNEAKNLECKKLGYALGLLEKHIATMRNHIKVDKKIIAPYTTTISVGSLGVTNAEIKLMKKNIAFGFIALVKNPALIALKAEIS